MLELLALLNHGNRPYAKLATIPEKYSWRIGGDAGSFDDSKG
jgi:hypothetical protein